MAEGLDEFADSTDPERGVPAAPHDALRAASRLSPTDPARLRAQAAFMREHAADMEWAAAELRGKG